jgi:RNA polymerase sigma-70 factor (ECF subfamily)
VSYGEPIALGGHSEIDQVAAAAPVEVRSVAEEQFLEKLQRGDAAAFERLVAERASDLYGLLFRLTSDAEEAHDLTQETFLRAFQNIGRFRGDADLKTWLYRIAVNQARNRWRWWRRRRRDETISLDGQDSDGGRQLGARLPDPGARDPETEALAHERETLLHEALRGLRHSYRETVVLRDVEGFTYEEIAAALEISIGTVKSRLARGRLELRRKLTGSF